MTASIDAKQFKHKKSPLITALKVLAALIGTVMLLLGMLSASGDLIKLLDMGNIGMDKTIDSTLPTGEVITETVASRNVLRMAAVVLSGFTPWVNAGIALAGIIIIGCVLNTVDPRKPDKSSRLPSKLLRKPLQKLFVVFLAPTLLAFCLGFMYPFVKGLFLSFCKFKTTSKWTWIGFGNYVNAIKDTTFVHAFWFTALFAIVSLLVINVLAFAVAYVLTKGIRGSNVFRTVFFMPNLIGGIVLGYIWSMIFDGILIRYNTSILLNTNYGFWGLQILMAWQQIGYMMIIYIAGLQAVPEDILEAAKIDGASGWKTLLHVTLPNMMPSITICTFLTLTNSFKLYDQNMALTGGSPFVQTGGTTLKTTEMLAMNIYNSFYANSSNRGVGQAKAVMFFVLVAVIGLIQLRATKNKEVQQ